MRSVKYGHPVFFKDKLITEDFDGVLNVENRYHFTNLNECEFSFRIVKFPAAGKLPEEIKSLASGKINVPPVEPGGEGEIKLDLPENWQQGDALYITAVDPFKREIFTWDWAISLPVRFMNEPLNEGSSDQALYEETAQHVVLKAENIRAVIEKSSGILVEVTSSGNAIPFNQGPVLVGGEAEFQDYRIFQDGQQAIFESDYSGNIEKIRWIMHANGLLKLEFDYFPQNHQPFYGISFDFPEQEMKKIVWLGEGPYRVWKNRLRGTQLNVWEKEYNNTITGDTYQYPEFKGYFSSFYWADFITGASSFKVYCGTENVYLRLYTPEQPEADPRFTKVEFPRGNISFLNGINAIGTKFKAPEALGPQSQLNLYQRHRTDRMIGLDLLFDFR
jgi:hypothetical protein